MGHSCCGHHHHDDDSSPAGEEKNHECGCGHDHGHAPSISPEDRKKLEEEISKAGFEVKEDGDGNIIIAKKED